jgi:hypothetical protein
MKTDICKLCGARIYLVKTGVETYKWVTNTEKPNKTWSCKRSIDFPLRSHAPKENKDEDN